MYSAVYRLRERGVKLSHPQPAVFGELRLQPHTIGTTDPTAVMAELLLEDGSDALPPLHSAQVRKVTRGGLVVVGTELIGRDSTKARARPYPQAWWCLLSSDLALHRLAGTRLSVDIGR